MKMLEHEAFPCKCQAGDVVLRQSHKAESYGKPYYACPNSKPRAKTFGCKFFLWKEDRVNLLLNSLGLSTTPMYPSGPSTAPMYPYGASTTQMYPSGPSTSPMYPYGPSTTPMYPSGPSTTPVSSPASSSRDAECANCVRLMAKLKVLQKKLEMQMHPENHTIHSAALLEDLYDDMANFSLH